MPLQIMQNLYPESWLYLTGHCYVRSMFAKHHFVAVFVCLFVVTVFFIIIIIIYFIIIVIFNWYKLDCKFFAELCKFFSNFK